MKIFERILDNRICEIGEITVNQAEFVKNCGITDAIHVARLLMEKHYEKHRPLYIAFLDLEKAFARVPEELITQCQKNSYAGFNCSTTIQEQNRFKPLLMDTKEARYHQSSLFLLWTLSQGISNVQRPIHCFIQIMFSQRLTTKNNLEQLVQQWNDLLMQHGLRLNLNKTELLMTDPHETGTVTVSGSDLPRTYFPCGELSLMDIDGLFEHPLPAL